MKLINYDYGSVMHPDSTYYRGKILMTYDEWQKAFKYLTSAKVKKSFLPSYPWTNTMLMQDVARQKSHKGNSYRIAVRVPMTEKLVNHYGLKGYKRVNYFIEITPN